MTFPLCRLRCAGLLALALTAASPVFAQDRGPNFLDNLFNRGDQEQQQQHRACGCAGEVTRARPFETRCGSSPARSRNCNTAISMLENQVRELQQRAGSAATGRARHRRQRCRRPASRHWRAARGPPPCRGRRSDVFDPSQQPNAPGAPHALGNTPREPPPDHGRRVEPGAPLDLNAPGGRSAPPPIDGGRAGTVRPLAAAAVRAIQVPTGPQLATLPPSAKPQDEYDLAYGYVLHKDYALAAQAFRDFLRKYPNERLVPDAQFWLGEACSSEQQYREAAEAFLAVSTKYEHSGKAPDALLRLGQSLAALHRRKRPARRSPRSAANIRRPRRRKRGAEQELKKQHC